MGSASKKSLSRQRHSRIAIAATVLLAPATVLAQDAPSGMSSSLVLMLVMSAIPFVFVTLTSFAKMSVVLSLARNAIGIGEVPSGMVITALAVMLSLYVMNPVGREIASVSAGAASASNLASLSDMPFPELLRLVDQAEEPLRSFLSENSGAREKELFRSLAEEAAHGDAGLIENDFQVVAPAFLVTELTEAFQMGFLIFLPFLVIDMVVANLLLALGMQSLNPTTISLPFKLLLFVLVDGWVLIARALVLGYA